MIREEPILFFKQWKQARGAILDEDHNGCKSAIVKAGGIETLQKIYMGTANMTKDGIDPTDQQSILLVIDALVFLSTNEDCRAKFAENTHNIWPLLHFVWNSSYLSTREEEVTGDPIEIDGEDGDWVRTIGYQTVLTKFGCDRDKSKTWLRSERSAVEVLWKLSLDRRCKQAFLELGTFVNSKYGVLTNLPDIRGQSHHAILGLVAIASRVGEADPDIKTDICFLRIAWDLLSDRYINPTEVETFNDKKLSDELPDYSPDLVERLPLLSRHEYDDYKRLPLLIRSIFDGDFYEHQHHCDCVLANCEALMSSGYVMEHFWVACLLLSMLTWEQTSWDTSRPQIVKLAVRSMSVLMDNIQVLRDFLASEAPMPLAMFLLCWSKSSDMEFSCIPFLVKCYEESRYIGVDWREYLKYLAKL